MCAVNKPSLYPQPNGGFTLTELTIVLVILALLIGGMLVPLSAQRDIQSTGETGKRLNEIKEALLGFAVLYGRLPCQSSTVNPADPKYGLEDSPCINDVEGYLPWKTLGVSEIDAWGTQRSASSDPFRGYWRYRVPNAYASATLTLSAPASNLTVQDSAGNALTNGTDGPVAIVYSTGADLVANGQNATVDSTYQAGERSNGFDDILVWIPRPILFNRMIAAGKLP